MDVNLSYVYLPSAIALGALHALEPGHAKTLTAAYLIGIKGTKWDAVLLGLSVAVTHSFVVVALSAAAVLIGRESFTDDAMYWLQVLSGGIVILLGAWLLMRRVRQLQRAATPQPDTHPHPHESPGVAHEPAHSHPDTPDHHHVHHPSPDHEHPHAHDHDHEPAHAHDHDHDHEHHHDHDHDHSHSHDGHDHNHDHGHDHDHDSLSDDEHARAHAATLPDYAKRGERPSQLQIMAFGAAGGMIPCPASVTVMLLALSVSQAELGLLLVGGFSLGLALTLVGIGLMVVAGMSRLAAGGRMAWLTRQAPLISAGMVILSGILALVVVFTTPHTHA